MAKKQDYSKLTAKQRKELNQKKQAANAAKTNKPAKKLQSGEVVVLKDEIIKSVPVPDFFDEPQSADDSINEAANEKNETAATDFGDEEFSDSEQAHEAAKKQVSLASRAATHKMSRKRIILLSGVIFLAIVIITMGILLPVVIIPTVKYSKTDNPVAIIKLDNGLKLEFEILEDKCPNVATNFLFLADRGFFDGVIFFDTQNNFVRFGGYTDPNNYNTRRERDESLLSKAFSDITVPSTSANKTKLQYKVKSDSPTGIKSDETGVLSFMTSESTYPTFFQICVNSNGAKGDAVQNKSGQQKSVSSTPFARFYSEETLVALSSLYASLSDTVGEPSSTSIGTLSGWQVPKTTVRIKSITLRNMNKAKWKKINFDNDILGTHTSW